MTTYPFCLFDRNWWICALAVFTLALGSLHAGEASPGTKPVDPSRIKVLLLPALDEPADPARRWPLREQIVRLRQQSQFISRHFVVVGEGMAVQAARRAPTLKIDTARDRSAGVLDELAARTGADWVLSVVVEEVDNDNGVPFDGVHFPVHARLSVRLRDARSHAWLTDRTYTSHTTGSGPPPEIQLDCTKQVADEAMAAVLSSYPEVVPVSRDGAIVDYLKGQTEPFVGEPGTLFSGLVAPATFSPNR